MRTNTAFTLVEICVVLATIGIMVALLFTTFSRVRESGRQATCQENLHQIHLAMAQYVVDNDSHLPQLVHWKQAIAPYTKNQQIFLCPSVSRPFHNDDGYDYGLAWAWLNKVTFVQSANGAFIPKAVGTHEATLVDASKIPLLTDAANTGNYEEVPLPRGLACGLKSYDGTPEISAAWPTLHQGGFNIVFYDGHVKWTSPQQGSAMECDIGPLAQATPSTAH